MQETTNARPAAAPRALSRRTLAMGALWSVPAVAVASAAPAFATSPGGCFRLRWDQWGDGTRVDGRTGAMVDATTWAPTSLLSTAVAISMGGTAGTASNTSNTPSTGLYSSTFNGTVGNRGEQVGYAAPGGYQLPALGEAKALILNIGHTTTTTASLTFSRPVRSISFTLFDVSKVDRSVSNVYDYTDTVSFSAPVTLSGDTTNLNATSGSGPFSRISREPSDSTQRIVVSWTGEARASFAITYTAPTATGWQFIGIGDVTVCL